MGLKMLFEVWDRGSQFLKLHYLRVFLNLRNLVRILEFFVRWILIEKVQPQAEKLDKYLKVKNKQEKLIEVSNFYLGI